MGSWGFNGQSTSLGDWSATPARSPASVRFKTSAASRSGFSPGVELDDPRYWPARPSEDDLLPGLHAFHKPRQVGLGLVHVHHLLHAENPRWLG